MTEHMRCDTTIAVTGLGVTSSLGTSAERTQARTLAGERGLAKIRAFDTTGCRSEIGGEAPDPTVPAELRAAAYGAYSRTGALALHAASAALEQAGWIGRERGRVGLVVGSAGVGTTALERYLDRRLEHGPNSSRAALLLGFPKRCVSDWVGWALELGGPRTTVNTACSSGAVAVIQGADWLRTGACDAVLAGGADELTRFTMSGFCSLRAVDPDPCRPFDRDRKGMSIGEGAGFLMLERRADAVARGATVLGILAGAGHTCDAGHLTAPDPQGAGGARAIRAALEAAGIGPTEIAFVSAHGTGTPHNDAAEVHALRAVFGVHAPTCPVHSAKASIGHCMGAAGAIEAALAVLSLTQGLVPPTAGLERPEFEGELDFVRGSPRRVSKPYAISNSFGFGGNNAALVFRRPEVRG